jgi:hypothetical protein
LNGSPVAPELGCRRTACSLRAWREHCGQE